MIDAGPVITIPDLDIIGIAAAITAVGVVILALRGMNKFMKRTNQFYDDWYGTEGDSVHPPVPGILNRMSNFEKSLDDSDVVRKRIEAKVDFAVHELTNNQGSSLKDSVDIIQLQQQEEVEERKAWAEQYIRDQHHNRLEWLHVFDAVRTMITLPPEEQMTVWDDVIIKYGTNTLVTKGEDEDEKG
jgi:hypothetical protein